MLILYSKKLGLQLGYPIMMDNQKAIDGCIKSIVDFCEGNGCFGRYRDKVQNYEWPKKGKSIDELLEEYNSSNGAKLSVDGKTNYEKNVALKKLISKKLEQEDLNIRAVSKWIIQKWGGITRLSKNIEAYIDCAKEKKYLDTLDGVASYSKLFAMFHYKEFAIYDARVAVSLNIVQLLSAEKNALFFPFLPGRNKITGHDPKDGRGFSRLNEFSKTQIVNTSLQEWYTTSPRAEVYRVYNDILKRVSKRIDWPLHDIEMHLFSKAEDLVHQIRGDQRFKGVDWQSVSL